MNEHYIGVIEQTEEERSKNYAFTEVVASANPVKWVEKKKPKGLQYFFNEKIWRKFPIRVQDGSGSCVAQTMAKLVGIMMYVKYGVFLNLSAGFYAKRSNTGAGMLATDAYKLAQEGLTLEELMPSQGMSEAQMNAIKENDLHRAVKIQIKNFVFLPIKDIDIVASTIQTTEKGVMCWYRFNMNEWKDVPVVLSNDPKEHHSIGAVDFTLYKGEKSLVDDESWGDTFGMDGQRVITESFHKERNTHVSYPIDFVFESETVQPTVKTFTKPLVHIKLDANYQPVAEMLQIHLAQRADVIALQDILKAEGLFPTNISSTGLYHNLTAKAVMAYQIKYNIASLEEINELQGKRVGAKTMAHLNSRK